MPKNVPFTLFCMSKAFYCLLLAAGLLLPVQASAQMFSVQSQPDRITIPESSVSAGVSFVDFRYRGPDGLLAADKITLSVLPSHMSGWILLHSAFMESMAGGLVPVIMYSLNWVPPSTADLWYCQVLR